MELKNGDCITITQLPSCRNTPRNTPNPYIGMRGIIHDLRDGIFNLYTGSSWLCGIKVKSCKYEKEAKKPNSNS